MKRPQILFLLFFCIIFFPRCEKQNTNPNKAWEIIIPDTLSKTIISSICEYNNNSIWIGTNYGILVYDNNSISSITTDEGLIDNVVLDIKKNSKNQLIIFTSEGINKYDGVMNEINTDGIGYTNYGYFAIDPYDNIWLLSSDIYPKALQKFNNDTNIYYNPFGIVGRDYGIDSERYTCIYADSKGRIWIGAYYSDIVLFSVDQDIIDYYYEKNKVEYVIFSITEDSNGNMWFTSGTNIVKFDGLNYNSYYDENLIWTWQNNIIADHNNDIWIVTINSVIKLHNEKWETEYIYTEHSFGDPNVDQFVTYSRIMEDSKNSIWICTDKGVIMKENN